MFSLRFSFLLLAALLFLPACRREPDPDPVRSLWSVGGPALDLLQHADEIRPCRTEPVDLEAREGLTPAAAPERLAGRWVRELGEPLDRGPAAELLRILLDPDSYVLGRQPAPAQRLPSRELLVRAGESQLHVICFLEPGPDAQVLLKTAGVFKPVRLYLGSAGRIDLSRLLDFSTREK